jgi:DNA-binding transcriptional ArsR family regulator
MTSVRASDGRASEAARTTARLTTFRLLAKYRFVNKVFKALSDPTRRRVLQLLRERPMSAGEISDHFAVSKPTMSAHFAVLQEAGLIESEKSGRTITYRLVMSVLEEALLGFAQTFGWAPESGRATRVNRHKVARRPVRGEA